MEPRACISALQNMIAYNGQFYKINKFIEVHMQVWAKQKKS